MPLFQVWKPDNLYCWINHLFSCYVCIQLLHLFGISPYYVRDLGWFWVGFCVRSICGGGGGLLQRKAVPGYRLLIQYYNRVLIGLVSRYLCLWLRCRYLCPCSCHSLVDTTFGLARLYSGDGSPLSCLHSVWTCYGPKQEENIRRKLKYQGTPNPNKKGKFLP